jgi:hypothetical protein
MMSFAAKSIEQATITRSNYDERMACATRVTPWTDCSRVLGRLRVIGIEWSCGRRHFLVRMGHASVYTISNKKPARPRKPSRSIVIP